MALKLYAVRDSTTVRDIEVDPRLAKTKFFISAPTLSQCPPECGPEIGFCGRSNAGKSSALNTLTGQKRLARVSKTPGRTQLINFFEVPGTGGFLVDLPGIWIRKSSRGNKKRMATTLGQIPHRAAHTHRTRDIDGCAASDDRARSANAVVCGPSRNGYAPSSHEKRQTEP